MDNGVGSSPDMQFFNGVWQAKQSFKIKRKKTVGNDRTGLMTQTQGCRFHMRADVGLSSDGISFFHGSSHSYLPLWAAISEFWQHPLLFYSINDHYCPQFSEPRMSSVCIRDALHVHTLAHAITPMSTWRVATPDHYYPWYSLGKRNLQEFFLTVMQILHGPLVYGPSTQDLTWVEQKL